MEPEEVSASRFQWLGNVLVWIGGLGGALVGLLLGLGAQAPQNLGVGLAVIPFLLLVLIGAFMLGGREQVEAVEEEMAAGEESKA
jgi:fucose permease